MARRVHRKTSWLESHTVTGESYLPFPFGCFPVPAMFPLGSQMESWPSCPLDEVGLAVEKPQARGDYLFYQIHGGRQNLVWHNFSWLLG
jgi:hypothetical protein